MAPSQQHIWRIVLLSAFGDESFDERNERVFAVAGLFGSEAQWDTARGAWLARTGGVIFHAADCETDMGDFNGNSHSENQRLYRDLTMIVCKSGLLGFGCAIDLAAFRDVFPSIEQNAPYYRCFLEVLVYFAQCAYYSIEQEQVEFTFDSRLETNFNTGKLYEYMAGLPEWKQSTELFERIGFGTRKMPGIQMADLLARETMKHLDNVVGPKRRPVRASMNALVQSRRFEMLTLGTDYFEGFRLRHGPEMVRWEELYASWLCKHNMTDSVSARYRFSIEIDIPAFLLRQHATLPSADVAGAC